MSTLITIAQSGLGLWLGLVPGMVIGFVVAGRRDDRAEQRLADELAINADLRRQLAEAKHRLLFYGRDTTLRDTARLIHGLRWPDNGLDAAARAARGTTGAEQTR